MDKLSTTTKSRYFTLSAMFLNGTLRVDEVVGVLSQEGPTQTHRSTRQISKGTGLTRCRLRI